MVWYFTSVKNSKSWGSPALFCLIQLIKALRVNNCSFTTWPCLQGKQSHFLQLFHSQAGSAPSLPSLDTLQFVNGASLKVPGHEATVTSVCAWPSTVSLPFPLIWSFSHKGHHHGFWVSLGETNSWWLWPLVWPEMLFCVTDFNWIYLGEK